ncbi:maltose acetyltransferase domain-containing protein [Anaerococcus sp. ENR0831]|uniref:Maltose acetyltransferase domain-containing protein n=1 Tax=Anaerococcus martiniensis TaxID=3115615 RepID=A0ABW9M7U0_9FIRM
MKTQKQRMINGMLYMGDEELRQDMYEARRKMQDFNKIIIIPKRVRQSFALFLISVCKMILFTF